MKTELENPYLEAGVKDCPRCDQTKSLEAFGIKTGTTDYPRSWCLGCEREASRAYYQKNKEKVRQDTYAWREKNPEKAKEIRLNYYAANKEKIHAQRRARKYGLSPEAYSALIEEGCQICGSKEKLRIDHDHACCKHENTCGKCVRGILCDKHNVGLGHFNDSEAELQAAIDYLKSYRT